MAIKIVGQSKETKRRTTCGNCGAVIEYLPLDVKDYDFHDYTGSDWGRAVTCPRCSEVLRVD